ncbi:MAG: T9SS type A sorting domain-containing protein [Bacteroidota bacterium]
MKASVLLSLGILFFLLPWTHQPAQTTANPVVQTPSPVASPLPQLDSLRIFPNPSIRQLTIDGLPQQSTVSIRLYNVLGRLLWEGQSTYQSAYQLDLQAFPRGAYLLQIQNGQHIQTRKIVKAQLVA